MDEFISYDEVHSAIIKNWNSLKANYRKAPYFKLYSPILQEFYCTVKPPLLSEIKDSLIKIICNLLSIKTRITNSADYIYLKGDPSEKLVSICKQFGATDILLAVKILLRKGVGS